MKKILIVSNNETDLEILNIILTKEGYSITTQKESDDLLDNIKNLSPDLIMLNASDFATDILKSCKLLKKEINPKMAPVIILAGSSNFDMLDSYFEYSVSDYIISPCNTEDLKIRISKTIKQVEIQSLKSEQMTVAEKKLKEINKKNCDVLMETIFSIAKLAQSRDDDTGKHLERISSYCSLLAKGLYENSPYSAQINKKFIKNIQAASPLHDIGKVGISDVILLKPAKLLEEEFSIMKRHVSIGFDSLSEVYNKFGDDEFIAMSMVIIRYHHERFDGKGYPDGLVGQDIPLAARIMAIADVYDALSSKRTYKLAYPYEQCVRTIKEGSGTQFDAVIVDKFLELSAEFDKIRQEFSN